MENPIAHLFTSSVITMEQAVKFRIDYILLNQ